MPGKRENSGVRRAIRLARQERLSVLEACRRIGVHPNRVYAALRNDRKTKDRK